MLKLLFSILFFLHFININGEKIELSGGLIKNNYFDYSHDKEHFRSKYSSGNGYSIGFSLEKNIIDSFLLKSTFKVENFEGALYTSNGGLAGNRVTDIEVNTLCIGLDIYPLNTKILKVINLNFGVSCNYLLKNEITGFQSWSGYFANGIQYFSSQNSNSINNNFRIGVICRFAYEILVHNNLFLLPQYLFYLGLTNEFRNIEANTKSNRHSIEIGIMYKLK